MFSSKLPLLLSQREMTSPMEDASFEGRTSSSGIARGAAPHDENRQGTHVAQKHHHILNMV